MRFISRHIAVTGVLGMAMSLDTGGMISSSGTLIGFTPFSHSAEAYVQRQRVAYGPRAAPRSAPRYVQRNAYRPQPTQRYAPRTAQTNAYRSGAAQPNRRVATTRAYSPAPRDNRSYVAPRSAGSYRPYAAAERGTPRAGQEWLAPADPHPARTTGAAAPSGTRNPQQAPQLANRLPQQATRPTGGGYLAPRTVAPPPTQIAQPPANLARRWVAHRPVQCAQADCTAGVPGNVRSDAVIRRDPLERVVRRSEYAPPPLVDPSRLSSPDRPSGPPLWPDSISGSTGFEDLGLAITLEQGYPRTGTDFEKVRYLFSRLPVVTQTYNLQANDRITPAALGMVIPRWYNEGKGALGKETDRALALKVSGVGNCGEWQAAFVQMLNGAGVKDFDKVVGDTAPGNDISEDDNHAAIVVREHGPNDVVSRRVFDPYYAVLYGASDPVTKHWSDRPLTDRDKWGDERHRQSWQDLTKMPYLKGFDGMDYGYRVGDHSGRTARAENGPRQLRSWEDMYKGKLPGDQSDRPNRAASGGGLR